MTSKQTEMPQAGQTVAKIKTNLGDIWVRFFPEQAPKAVENFIQNIPRCLQRG